METKTADDLAATLISEAPAPSDQADAIAATLEKARADSAPGPALDTTAPGKVETRGRHKKGCACPSCAAKAIGTKSSPKTTAATDPFTAPAISLVALITGSAQMFLDPVEWKPEPAETDMMVRALHDQFERSGTTDLPPMFALLVAFSGYVLPRLSKPKTTTRMQRIVAWFKGEKKKDEAKE